MIFPKAGQWCVVDGLNLREGPHRWKYTMVLAVYDTENEAMAATPEPLDMPSGCGPYPIDLSGDEPGMMVGPVKRGDWFHEFDSKLWIVVLDPDGYTTERTVFTIPGIRAA